MDDFFIPEYFDWKMRRNSYIDRFLNRDLGKAGLLVGSAASFLLDKVHSTMQQIESQGRKLRFRLTYGNNCRPIRELFGRF
jgi:hypothetical protein